LRLNISERGTGTSRAVTSRAVIPSVNARRPRPSTMISPPTTPTARKRPARAAETSLTVLAEPSATKKEGCLLALSVRKAAHLHPRSITVLVTLSGGMILLTVMAPPTLGDIVAVKDLYAGSPCGRCITSRA